MASLVPAILIRLATFSFRFGCARGQNTLLFQVGRGRLKARLTKPRAAAFLSTADVTLPDLALGERAEYEASVLAVNASESSRNHLTIVARLPDGQETRTVVPALVPLSVRKVAFEFRVDVPPGSETVPIELKLKQKTGHDEHSEGETLDAVKITVRARKPGQTYTRTFQQRNRRKPAILRRRASTTRSVARDAPGSF